MAHIRPKAVVSWSSGKDSAYALWEILRRRELDVVALLTTVTGTFSRVSMHGVRVEMLDRQAESCGLSLRKVEIPSPCPNEIYERAMSTAISAMRAEGITHIVFGDLFLQEIREYRESRLAPTGMRPVFPLWGMNTTKLARSMIECGLTANIVCIDPRKLSKDFAGRRFDSRFLQDLPPSVDPCGENGEFHTFVSAGPMFSRTIPIVVGQTVERDGFVFTDILPG